MNFVNQISLKKIFHNFLRSHLSFHISIFIGYFSTEFIYIYIILLFFTGAVYNYFTKHSVRTMIDAVDTNKCGRINFEEFKALVYVLKNLMVGYLSYYIIS